MNPFDCSKIKTKKKKQTEFNDWNETATNDPIFDENTFHKHAWLIQSAKWKT